MKKINLILLTIALVTISCNLRNTNEEIDEVLSAQENSTTTARQPTKLSSDYSRVQEDLVQKLYNEELLKNKKLQQLDFDINKLRETTTENFRISEKYKSINAKYFESAKYLTMSISDSIARNEMTEFFAELENNYSNKLKPLHKSISQLENAFKDLNDRESIIKLVNSIEPMIKYQENKIPSSLGIDSLTQSVNNLLKNSEEFVKIKE